MGNGAWLPHVREPCDHQRPAFQLGCCIEGPEASLADNRQLGHDFGLAFVVGRFAQGAETDYPCGVRDYGRLYQDGKQCELFL